MNKVPFSFGVFQDKRYALALLFVVALIATAIEFYLSFVNDTRANAFREIAAVGELKAQQIEQWRKERLGDAETWGASPYFSKGVMEWLERPEDPDRRKETLDQLQHIRDSDGYADAFLLDLRGETLLGLSEESASLTEEARGAVESALADDTAKLSELYKSANGKIYMDVVVPIKNGNGRTIAAFVLRSDANSYLFPLIESWPMPSETGETILVRRDGEDALFLNDLRFQEDAALNLRVPLTQGEVPAVQAILGKKGTFEGKDYRGEKALADLRPIRDSNWFIVSKVDSKEALADARFHLQAAVFSIVALIALAVGIVAYGYRQRQAGFYREMYALETEGKRAALESEERMRAVTHTANDAIVSADAQGRVVYWNPAAEKTFGFEADEALGMSLRNIASERFREAHEAGLRRFIETGEPRMIGKTVEESAVRKSGEEFPIEISLAAWNMRGAPFFTAIIRDITERKRAEEKLRESEERFRTTLYSIGDGVVTTDANGNILIMNLVAEYMTGWKEAEARGRHIDEAFVFINEATRERVENPILRAIRNGTVTGFEERSLMVSRDGSEYPISDSGAPIRNIKGGITGGVLVFQNQTVEREIRKALNESEEKFRQFFEQSSDGIVLLDEEGKIIEWNNALAEITGLARREAMGRSFLEIQIGFTPEELNDPDAFQRQKEAFVAALTTGRAPFLGKTLASPFRKKNGEIRFVQQTAFPIKTPRGFRIGLITRDVTELKRAEDELRRQAVWQQFISEAVISTDLESKIIGWNDAATRAYGWSAAEAIGANMRELLKTEVIGVTLEQAQAALAQTGIWRGQVQQKNKRGDTLFLDASVAYLKNDDGKIIGEITVNRDVTDRKRGEMELLYAKASAEAANRELQEAFKREQVISRTDGLTGIFNRRYFFDFAENEVAVSRRYRRPLSLILFDLDHFKDINDTWGHNAGDLILKNVARAAQEQLREADILARYGGEEFVILLPNSDLQASLAIAEQIREKIAALQSDIDAEKIFVTISVGVSVLGEDDTVDQFVQRADKSLYAAKNEGRNRVGRV